MKSFGDILSLTVSDVTALKRREASFRLLFDNNPMPMWVFDAETTQFLSVNDAAVQHYGYARETFLGMQLRQIWPEDEWATHSQALQQLGDVYNSSHDWRHLKSDGSEIHVLTFGRRVAFDGRDGYLVAVVDITERRKAEARIAHMAHHDGLTNLPNRDFFQDRLHEALQRGKSGQRRVAVLCVDLDLFKNVNDSFGHPMGDRLLKQVAGRLKAEVSGDNLVARLGGDEFAIVLAADASPNGASDFAARMIRILSESYDIDGIEVTVGASIGIALSPGDGETSEELMRNADMALYRAKSEGGGVHRFFEREMDQQARRRRDMELDLRRAFANGEFELHYQPLVDIAADRISGFEVAAALAPPGERHDLAGGVRTRRRGYRIDRRARRVGIAGGLHRGGKMACGHQGRRQSVAGAVSQPQPGAGGDLGAGAFRFVAAAAGARNHRDHCSWRRPRPIWRSCISCASSASASRWTISVPAIPVSSYLRSFPFDKIKIDRSFVKDLVERSDCVAIVRAISGLGRSLNITTTAEGVETADQLDWLRAEGCNEVQGFLFSAAKPASEIAELLARFGARVSQAA